MVSVEKCKRIETYLIIGNNKTNKMLQECHWREWWDILVAYFVHIPAGGIGGLG
jgi:hypothetical protein